MIYFVKICLIQNFYYNYIQEFAHFTDSVNIYIGYLNFLSKNEKALISIIHSNERVTVFRRNPNKMTKIEDLDMDKDEYEDEEEEESK